MSLWLLPGYHSLRVCQGTRHRRRLPAWGAAWVPEPPQEPGGKTGGPQPPEELEFGIQSLGVVLGQDMLTFAANFAPSSMPISSALTFDPCQLFPALYGAFSCRDLPLILGLPVCESCARVTRGRLCPRAPNWWQEGCADEGRAPSTL